MTEPTPDLPPWTANGERLEKLRLAREIVELTEAAPTMAGTLIHSLSVDGSLPPERLGVVVISLTRNAPGLVDVFAKVYAEALSLESLQAARDFYSSPGGREFSGGAPKMIQGMTAGVTEWAQKVIADSGLDPEAS